MNNLLEESIHLFINITSFNPIICRTLKRHKKKSGISRHHNNNVKESKASHILIPIFFKHKPRPPYLQVPHTNKSIQRKLNLSNQKRKSLKYKNYKIWAQTKFILVANRSIMYDACKDKKIFNTLIQGYRAKSRTKK